MNIALAALPAPAVELLARYNYTGSQLVSQAFTSEGLLDMACFYEGMGYYPEAGHAMVRALDLAFVEEVLTDLWESDEIVALEAIGFEEAYRLVRMCKREYDYDSLFCADELRKRAGLL